MYIRVLFINIQEIKNALHVNEVHLCSRLILNISEKIDLSLYS